jgi:hypothetical protein
MSIDKKKFKVEPDEDDGMTVLSLAKHLEDDTKRKKNQTAKEFEELGDDYLKEIERKKHVQKLRQTKLIPYILKHRGDIYDKEELLSYSFEDIQEIYDEIKTEKRSWIIKLFQLFSSNE